MNYKSRKSHPTFFINRGCIGKHHDLMLNVTKTFILIMMVMIISIYLFNFLDHTFNTPHYEITQTSFNPDIFFRNLCYPGPVLFVCFAYFTNCDMLWKYGLCLC